MGSWAVWQRTSIAWPESVPDLGSTGEPSRLLHYGTLRVSSSSSHHLLPPWAQSPWPRAVGPGWAQPQELRASWQRRDAASAVPGMEGLDLRAVGKQHQCHWARTKPHWSRRGLHPSWHERSMGILHFAPEEMQISPSPGQGPTRMETELQQHPHIAHPPAEMPTTSCGVCPVGLSPVWAHPGVVVGDGEAMGTLLMAGVHFQAPRSGDSRCISQPSPRRGRSTGSGADTSGSALGPYSWFTAKPFMS